MKEIRPYLIVASAVLTFLSFPPFPFGPLILIALAPFFYAIEDLTPDRAFRQGFLWGLVFYLGLVYYIAWVTIPGMVATVLILALIPASACWVYLRLLAKNRGLALVFLPAYFVTWNWLLTKSELNYPWCDFGYALSYFRTMIQSAEIGGVYLVTLFILAVNMLVYASMSQRLGLKPGTRSRLRYAAIALIIIFFAYGKFRLAGSNLEDHSRKGLAIGLLQGDMTKDVKWSPAYLQLNFDTYFSLSREVAPMGVQLLIWPETAIPTYLVQEPQNLARVKALVDSLNVPLLTGVPYYQTVGPNQYEYYNSAILLKPHQSGYQLYSKVHLVPMSERIPYVSTIKFLKDLRLGWGDFTPGRQLTIFDLDGFHFGTLICFESAFPGFAREFVTRGAQFLVVITNDMWFGRTSLYQQHAMMAVFRAVENRVPVVRAGNTGITMYVDKWGGVPERTHIFDREYLVARIYPENSNSIYRKVGDIVPKGTLAVTLVSLAVAFWRRRGYTKEAL